MRTTVLVASVTLALLAGGAARAGEVPTEVIHAEAPAPGWFVPVGLNLGLSVGLEGGDVGFLAGGEVSAVYLFGTTWTGAYADGLYDTFGNRGRVSLGLEGGWFVLGGEVGYVVELGGPEAAHGVRVGALITGSVLAGYLRWNHLVRDADADTLEIGILVKWPFDV